MSTPERTHIVLHTTAFREPSDIELIKRWHTDPRPDPNNLNRFYWNRRWYESESELPLEIRGRRGNGWNDVGYHYFIKKDGEIQKGRPEHVNGAHCADRGYNRISLGICFEGHHNFEEWTPEQWVGFKKLLRDIFRRFNIPTSNIIGHREAPATKDCPGTKIDMTQVRREIGQWRVGTI